MWAFIKNSIFGTFRDPWPKSSQLDWYSFPERSSHLATKLAGFGEDSTTLAIGLAAAHHRVRDSPACSCSPASLWIRDCNPAALHQTCLHDCYQHCRSESGRVANWHSSHQLGKTQGNCWAGPTSCLWQLVLSKRKKQCLSSFKEHWCDLVHKSRNMEISNMEIYNMEISNFLEQLAF